MAAIVGVISFISFIIYYIIKFSPVKLNAEGKPEVKESFKVKTAFVFIFILFLGYGLKVATLVIPIDESARIEKNYADWMDKKYLFTVEAIISMRYPYSQMNPEKISDDREHTLLTLAVDYNNIEAVKAMLTQEIDADHLDDDGDTALLVSLEENYFDIAELLVNAGADVNYIFADESREEGALLKRFTYSGYRSGGEVEVFTWLLKHGVKTDDKNFIQEILLATEEQDQQDIFIRHLIKDLYQEGELNQEDKQYEKFLLSLKDNSNQEDMIKAYFSGSSSSYMKLAAISIENANYEQAIEYFKHSVEKGSTDAMIKIGELYISQMQDFDKGVEWYQKAYKRSSSEAAYKIGLAYEFGYLKYKEAIQWYETADKMGDKSSAYRVVYIARKNIHDKKLEKKWLIQAAKAGHYQAIQEVQELYPKALMTEDGDIRLNQFPEIKAVEKTAINSADESFKLAQVYKKRIGDNTLAMKWYKNSYKLGDAQIQKDSAYSLGELYYDKEDYKNTEKYFLIAKDLGKKYISYTLGILYESHLKDDKKAIKYHLEAANNGEVLSPDALGQLYEKIGDSKNAEKWYLKSFYNEHGMFMPSTILHLSDFYLRQKRNVEGAAYRICMINTDMIFRLDVLRVLQEEYKLSDKEVKEGFEMQKGLKIQFHYEGKLL
jgi:TPR repeat protein